MKRIVRYLLVILLSLSTTPCFSAQKLEKIPNSQALKESSPNKQLDEFYELPPSEHKIEDDEQKCFFGGGWDQKEDFYDGVYDFPRQAENEALVNPSFEVLKELAPHISQVGIEIGLKLCLKQGYLNIAEELLQHASKNTKKRSIETIVENDNLNVLKQMLPHADQYFKNEALLKFAGKGYLEGVKEIFPFVNDQKIKTKSLELAAKNGQLEVAEYLLSRISQTGKELAEWRGYLKIASSLKNPSEKTSH